MAGLLATIELCLGPCDAWIKERNLEEVNTSNLVAMNIATATVFFRGKFWEREKDLNIEEVGWSGVIGQVFGKCVRFMTKPTSAPSPLKWYGIHHLALLKVDLLLAFT